MSSGAVDLAQVVDFSAVGERIDDRRQATTAAVVGGVGAALILVGGLVALGVGVGGQVAVAVVGVAPDSGRRIGDRLDPLLSPVLAVGEGELVVGGAARRLALGVDDLVDQAVVGALEGDLVTVSSRWRTSSP